MVLGERFIHSMAVVESVATVGFGTKVWQFASVIRGAQVGQRCSVGACAIVDGAEVGDDVLIGHGASIHPGTKIEDMVFIGPGAVICNDAWPRVSKEGFKITGTTVLIERGASIGARAIVLPGRIIGQGAMVAAGVVVDQDIPPRCIMRRDGAIADIGREDGRLEKRVQLIA